MEEDHISRFVNVLLITTRTSLSVSDKFFATQVETGVANLVRYFLLFERGGDSVAQYKNSLGLRSAIQALDKTLETILYLGIATPSPLLQARKKIIEFEFSLPKSFQSKSQDNFIQKEKVKEKEISKTILSEPAPLPLQVSSPGPRLTVNQEKILDFIRQSPEIKPKEVLEEFSVLSERTVKRTVSDLMRLGFIKRTVKDKNIFYELISVGIH